MRHLSRAGTQMEHWNKLGAGINCQPEPQHLFVAAQPCSQFVQLEVWEPEIARCERSCKV
jgi:hypothetical protein